MSTVLRPIDPAGYKTSGFPEAGPAPQLAWLKITDLVVDEGYQRRISKAGRKSVQAIAENFDWSMFSPLICAPLEGGRYAIIDGQHRTTAAAVRGFEQVPCEIVQADRRKQAAAFAAVNGQVQRISTMQIYHAAVEAEEPWATGIATVAAAAGVVVLKYPIAAHLPARPRHSTMSVRTIQRMNEKHGPVFAATVLRCITRTGLGDDPGVLGDRWITAISSALEERPKWVEEETRLLAFFEELDAGAAVQASLNFKKNMVVSSGEALAIVLRAELDVAEPTWAPQPVDIGATT